MNLIGEDEKRPNTPLPESVIYEVHVKGFTKLNDRIPEVSRGTYAGLGSAEAIEYLKNLGVTAVELLPVHAHVDDKVLLDRDLTNYWGYNSIGFFAPHGDLFGFRRYGGAGDGIQNDGAESSRRRSGSHSRRRL